jgi:hypothetical protein
MASRVRRRPSARWAREQSICSDAPTLDVRLRATLGYTVRTAIRRVRLERARHLVSGADLPPEWAAAACSLS